MTQQAGSARPTAGLPTPPGTGRRIAYAGRIALSKGVHTLIEAVVRSPRLPIRLDVYGIVQDAQNYMDQLQALTGKDARIRFLPPVANDLVINTLRSYDAVAVPSIGVESGPLTVYDAFAAGVPVIGSRRGGIAELVTHEQDGLLVEATDVAAWTAAMIRISTEDGLVERLRRGVRPPRTMDTVAGEMLELYEKLARQLVSAEGRLS
jgi:glycosyltransferase involved in cell wall biosynthesis